MCAFKFNQLITQMKKRKIKTFADDDLVLKQ
jgi:hypothetical protein